MSNVEALLRPLQLGEVSVANRVFMAPLTRARTVKDHVPNALMAEMYAQRASGGLLIAEATMVQEGHCAFIAEPGVYSQAQVEGWRLVTDAVHANGGKIFLQLWHGGRATHPDISDGTTPISCTTKPIEGETHTLDGKKPYVPARKLSDDEIPNVVAAFRQAAVNAKAAGFDGVEVHGANGYILDQFLRDGSNTDPEGDYGGRSIETRSRLLIEVIEAVSSVFGSQRVGVRVSPLNSFNSMIDSDPIKHYTWLAKRLNSLNLAYLHVMRSDFFGVQKGDVLTPIRAAYKGLLVGNMGYTPAEAAEAIAQGKLDAVAFGTPFLANPDLPKRIKLGAALNAPNPNTFYTPGAEGYTDYPPLSN